MDDKQVTPCYGMLFVMCRSVQVLQIPMGAHAGFDAGQVISKKGLWNKLQIAECPSQILPNCCLWPGRLKGHP